MHSGWWASSAACSQANAAAGRRTSSWGWPRAGMSVRVITCGQLHGVAPYPHDEAGRVTLHAGVRHAHLQHLHGWWVAGSEGLVVWVGIARKKSL